MFTASWVTAVGTGCCENRFHSGTSSVGPGIEGVAVCEGRRGKIPLTEWLRQRSFFSQLWEWCRGFGFSSQGHLLGCPHVVFPLHELPGAPFLTRHRSDCTRVLTSLDWILKPLSKPELQTQLHSEVPRGLGIQHMNLGGTQLSP